VQGAMAALVPCGEVAWAHSRDSPTRAFARQLACY